MTAGPMLYAINRVGSSSNFFGPVFISPYVLGVVPVAPAALWLPSNATRVGLEFEFYVGRLFEK